MDNTKFTFTKSTYRKKYNKLLSDSGFYTTEELIINPEHLTYHIHHIDHNRGNNYYRNLVRIEDYMHRIYHESVNKNILFKFKNTCILDITKDDLWVMYWAAIRSGDFDREEIQSDFFKMERCMFLILKFIKKDRDSQHDRISNLLNAHKLIV